MDLSDLIARNAAFSPNKAAPVFEGEVLSYRVYEQIESTARALKAECGVGRGDRVAILSLNRPDYLVLLYACARLGAMLVPLNWRLAAAEQMFILSDAAVKVLVLEQAFAEFCPLSEAALPETRVVGLDFTPPPGISFDALLAGATGDSRNPHVDLSCPVLIVYTSGTTGRPKGAVLRQEALLWNGVMSQHMHGLNSGRSRADRAAVLSCRRAQHPDHAGAASRRDGDDPFPLHAGRGAAALRTTGRR